MNREGNNIFERRGFMSNLIRIIGVMLFFSAILFAMYAPVIQKDFFYQNDELLKTKWGEPAAIWEIFIKEGRFTNAFLMFHVYSHIRSSESTKIIRLIAIIVMSLFASVMWAILRLSRFRSDHALLVSALICTLPTSQEIFLWIVIIPYIYGALLSSLSALIMFNVIYKERNQGKSHEIIWIFTAIVLLVTSLTIHQTMAMMYWAVGIIVFLSWDNYDFFKKYRRPLVKYFFVGFVSIAIDYVVFIKIVPFIMNFQVERSHLVPIHRIPVKLIKFLIIPFNNAINLWNVSPSYIFSIFVIVIIIGGIKIDLLKGANDKRHFLVSNYLQKYYLILCLLILSYLPNLIVAEDAFTYRTLLPLASALSVLFCFGLINIVEFFKFIPNSSSKSRTITVLLIVLVIVTAFLARYNAVHWDSPAQLDSNLWKKWKIP